MEKISFVLIGCGRIAYKYVEALVQNHQQAVLSAVCDVVLAKAQAKAEEYQAKLFESGKEVSAPKVFTDYKELLANTAAQVAIIATESGKHAKIAKYCLERKIHVLVEKPMTLATTDSADMIALARKQGVKLGVAHQNRFNAPIVKLRQAVEAGRFGRLIAGNARILWQRSEEYYRQAPWRGTFAQDGGCLMNQCIHNINILQWMLGWQITKVQAMLGNYLHPYIEAEDYGSVQLKFANGAIGNVEGTVCVFRIN